MITRENAKRMVGPGWASLIDEIYDILPEDVCVTQVKEKFGGLRFYVGSASSEIFDFIDKIEAKSLTICEQCGEPGEARRGGWIKTLCDAHERERQDCL